MAPGSNAQIFMFVGGKLASADASASITNFVQSYPDADEVSAGSLAGRGRVYRDARRQRGSRDVRVVRQ